MAEEGDLRINGTTYDPNTMSFREDREANRIMRDELFNGVLPDRDELTIADTLPAVALVLMRRDNPACTLDDALDLVYQDVMVTAEMVEAEKKKRPTQRAPKAAGAKTSTSASTGSPNAA